MMDIRSLREAGCIIKESSALPLLTRAARWASDSPLRGAMLGAGVGAAHGYANRQEGQSGLAAAAGGGLRGAALGAGAGGLARHYRDVRLLNPALGGGQAVGETMKSMGRGLKNFGKRQLHGMTGAYSNQAAEIGMRGTATSEKKIDLLRRRLMDKMQHGEITPTRGLTGALDSHISSVRNLRETGVAGDAAAKAGLTNIPGLARGLVRDPKATLKAVGREAMLGGPQAMALGVGLPLALSAPDIARGDESATGGKSLRQKFVGMGSGMAAGTLTAGMPIIPQIMAQSGIERGLSVFGGRKVPPPMPQGAA